MYIHTYIFTKFSHNFMKSIPLELKIEVNISPLIGDFNTSLSPKDKASQLKIGEKRHT